MRWLSLAKLIHLISKEQPNQIFFVLLVSILNLDSKFQTQTNYRMCLLLQVQYRHTLKKKKKKKCGRHFWKAMKWTLDFVFVPWGLQSKSTTLSGLLINISLATLQIMITSILEMFFLIFFYPLESYIFGTLSDQWPHPLCIFSTFFHVTIFSFDVNKVQVDLNTCLS